LWMTSRFAMMDRMACGIGSIFTSAVLEQIVTNFLRIRQVAPHCLTLSSYTVAANCAPRALAMTSYPGAVIGWWPAACRIKAGADVCSLRLPCSGLCTLAMSRPTGVDLRLYIFICMSVK